MTSPEQQLFNALQEPDMKAIRQVVDAGEIDLDSPLQGTGETALHLLVKRDQMTLFSAGDDEKRAEAMVFLLLNGADPNVEDSYGKSPFHEAVFQEDKLFARLLLSYGADIDAVDCEGRTPLNRAVLDGDELMAEWLMEQGADASIEDIHFSTPADNALNLGHYPLHNALLEYEMPPRAYIDPALTKEELLEHNELGMCPLDSNLTWYRLSEVRAAIESKGEYLTKDELLCEGRDEKTYFQRGLECGQGEAMFAALKEAGESFTPTDLLDGNSPNKILQVMMDAGEVKEIFCKEFWQNQPASAMRQVYHALPKEVQDEIPNLHALTAEISRHNRMQAEPER